MTEDLQERRLLEFEIWEAAMKRSFQILYQPQVDLAQGHITGVEALLRWESARFGSISPAEFIPIAERLGLIPTVGQWVLDQACMAAASWPDDVRVAVNVSSLQFASDNFAEWVSRTLARAGLPASRLEIEITETLFMQENKAVSATLARLRETGVAIAIDDFGTGYSALQYLQRFKVDKIKIDRSFVTAMLHNEESRAIVRAIADLAEGLGVRLNAEGIETEEQRAMLRAFGCQEGQGYLFGKAASADEIMRRLGAAHPGRAIARAS
ncbi:MAG TPA: EAL domain-containing protein, partial [Dongiaceae bacterium]|nr:EAL domain-containing protein [Dongiaceae bacterium]